MKHGSPTWKDVMRLGDNQELVRVINKRAFIDYLKYYKKTYPELKLCLCKREIRYLIQLLEKEE